MSIKKEALKSILINEIEYNFGRRIMNYRDCVELGDEIYDKTHQRLNSITLRRFFGLVKSDYAASHSTLNIFAQYCGFNSINEITKIDKNEDLNEKDLNPDSLLHLMVSLIGNTEVKDLYDHTFLNVVLHTIHSLNNNKFLADKFQSIIAKTKNGQQYYFEQLVNVDKLNSFYGNGLRYYLNEKSTIEAEIFTASILVLKHWLNAENEALLEKKIILIKSVVVDKMHPYLVARRYAAMILYANVEGSDSEAYRVDIHHVFTELYENKEKNKYLLNFTQVIAEALFFGEYYEESLYYMKSFFKLLEHEILTNGFSNKYIHCLNLLMAYCEFQLGHFKEASKTFKKVKVSEFPFLKRKLYNVLFLSLNKQLKGKGLDQKYDDQINLLIEELGFKRLKIFSQIKKKSIVIVSDFSGDLDKTDKKII